MLLLFLNMREIHFWNKRKKIQVTNTQNLDCCHICLAFDVIDFLVSIQLHSQCLTSSPKAKTKNKAQGGARGVHSLLYFAYTCVRDLFIGGVIYLAKKIIRWWYFTCTKPENIMCDGILHVNMFHYFKIPYCTCTFFTKFTYNEYIGPYFLSHVVLWFLPVISSRGGVVPCGGKHSNLQMLNISLKSPSKNWGNASNQTLEKANPKRPT
jgi:hypothetical protein